MTHEVIVVGGGIGGLTVAALLAARGVDVCLLERQPDVGGCAAPLEHAGYRFEFGAGFHHLWEPGEIHRRIFAELPVPPPEVRPVVPSYHVRLPDGASVSVTSDDDQFFATLAADFPECAGEAIRFYRYFTRLGETLWRAVNCFPHLTSLSAFEKIQLLVAEPQLSVLFARSARKKMLALLRAAGLRFRSFIDTQLINFVGATSENCSLAEVAVALTIPRRSSYAIKGGTPALAAALLASLKKSGGTVRLNAAALRLSDHPRLAVTLLSGETLSASRAVVSNLTVWDTYGKLVGLNHLPGDFRARLKNLTGWGRYLMHVGLKEEASPAADQIIGLASWPNGTTGSPEEVFFAFGVAPRWDQRAPNERRSATVAALVDVERWFAFHEDESHHENEDRRALEIWWERLSRCLPELSESLELIETTTPYTIYETTRRKLGIVGAPRRTAGPANYSRLGHRTLWPGLYLVGDTVSHGQGATAVTHAALVVANEIAPPSKP